MNNLVKNTLIFVTGGLIGAVGSYIGLKVVFDRVLEEQKALAKEEARQELAKEQATKAEKQKVTDNEEMPFKTEHKVSNDTLTPPEDEQEFVNYRKYYTDEDVLMKGIERIDADSFHEVNGFEKRYISYDENHDMFFDEYDDMIEGDIINLIGEENLEYFGEYEERTLFIRNHNTQTDFEITVEFRADDED